MPNTEEAPRPRLRSFVLTLAAAALASAISLYASSKNGAEPRAEATRAKVALTLGVVVQKTDGALARLTSRGPVAPGESLRFELSCAESGFAGVLGVGSDGVVTPYAPASGSLRPLAGGPPVVLNETVVVDETLGTERLIAVSCEHPVPLAEIVTAAERALAAAGRDPERVSNLRTGCAEARLDIVKRHVERR